MQGEDGSGGKITNNARGADCSDLRRDHVVVVGICMMMDRCSACWICMMMDRDMLDPQCSACWICMMMDRDMLDPHCSAR